MGVTEEATVMEVGDREVLSQEAFELEQFLESLYMKEAEVGVTEAREVGDREGAWGPWSLILNSF